MKIHEIRVLIEPSTFNENFYTIWVTVHPEYHDAINLKKIYPISYVTSIFDQIWEDIGRELKKGLLESENNG